MTVSVNAALLSSTSASRLSLALPGTKLIRQRADVPTPQEPASPGSASGGHVSTWVGEVAGRKSSTAVLVTAANGGVYGKVSYTERRANKQRQEDQETAHLHGEPALSTFAYA